jgi:hypothetical protein
MELTAAPSHTRTPPFQAPAVVKVLSCRRPPPKAEEEQRTELHSAAAAQIALAAAQPPTAAALTGARRILARQLKLQIIHVVLCGGPTSPRVG